jgi:uncharacterized protein (TIGR00369 family)
MAKMPYARFLGMKVKIESGQLLTCLPTQEKLTGNPNLPALHGGVIGRFLELTALSEWLFRTGEQDLPRTTSFSVDYLRSGRMQDTFGRAVITRQGRRISNIQATIWQSNADKPVAVARCNLLSPAFS